MTNNKVTIIAECGVNHNGDLALAKEMVDLAHKAGADYVKFQTYKTDNLIKKDCPMAQYQIENLQENKTQYEMLKQYELSENDFLTLYDYSQKKGIKFLSTPFDLESLEFLVSLGLKTVKISSGDLTNAPLLLQAAKKGVQVILSTGMAYLKEIDEAIAVLYWGYNSKEEPSSLQQILNLLPQDFEGSLYNKVSLLHCSSEYPAPVENTNLLAIKTLKERYPLKIGYSDHTLGNHITYAATALGSCIIEKHFTIDKNLPGPDHKASLSPDELTAMVKCIKELALAMGDGVKKPRGNEEETALLVRKGLYAKKFIAKNKTITADDIICLRPATDNSPMHYWDYINKKSQKDLRFGDPL